MNEVSEKCRKVFYVYGNVAQWVAVVDSCSLHCRRETYSPSTYSTAIARCTRVLTTATVAQILSGQTQWLTIDLMLRVAMDGAVSVPGTSRGRWSGAGGVLSVSIVRLTAATGLPTTDEVVHQRRNDGCSCRPTGATSIIAGRPPRSSNTASYSRAPRRTVLARRLSCRDGLFSF